MAWLKDKYPDLVPIVNSSGRIVGGRFLMSLRLLMLLEPLWQPMTEFMEDYSHSFGGEGEVNRLAQAVHTYLHQPFRRGMVRAGALIYGSFLGPLLFQLRCEQKPLPCGIWWRAAITEVEMLARNPAEVQKRLEAGNGLWPGAGWTFADEQVMHRMKGDVLFTKFVSDHRQVAHQQAMTSVNRGTGAGHRTRTAGTDGEDPLSASTEKTMQPLQYCLHFLQEQLRHYGRRFLAGGDLHPDNITDTVKDLLESTQLIGLNDLVERMFAIVDNRLTVTATCNQTGNLAAYAMCKENMSNQDWEDNLRVNHPEKWAEHLKNAQLKADELKDEYAKQHKVQVAAKRDKFEADVIAGKEKLATRLRKANELLLRSDQRIKSTEMLQRKLDSVVECHAGSITRKRDIVIVPELQVYSKIFGTMLVRDWDGKTMIPLKDLKSQKDDAPLVQQKIGGKWRDFDVLKENVGILMRRTLGLVKSARDVQREAMRLLPRDSRQQNLRVQISQLNPAVCPALLKKKAANAVNEKSSSYILGGGAVAAAAAAAAKDVEVAVAAAAVMESICFAVEKTEALERAEGCKAVLVLMDEAASQKLKVAEMKAYLNALGLCNKGKKAELLFRLAPFFKEQSRALV